MRESLADLLAIPDDEHSTARDGFSGKDLLDQYVLTTRLSNQMKQCTHPKDFRAAADEV